VIAFQGLRAPSSDALSADAQRSVDAISAKLFPLSTTPAQRSLSQWGGRRISSCA
jgi:hypothetical protein